MSLFLFIVFLSCVRAQQLVGTIGTSCINDSGCKRLLVCRPYTATSSSKKRCTEIAQEAWTCDSSVHCNGFLECQNFRCVKPDSKGTKVDHSQKTGAKMVRGIGEVCLSNSECKTPFVCRPYTASSASKKRCEKKGKEFWTCSSSYECVENLACKNFRCKKVLVSKIRVQFKRVYDDYPLHVFEAGGTVLPSNGSMYLTVFGGFYRFPGVTAKVYRRIFGREQANWESVTNLPYPAATHMAQAVDGSLFCCVGGFPGKFPGVSAALAFCFDSEKGKYTRLPYLPAPRAGGGLALVKKGAKRSIVYSGGTFRDKKLRHTDFGNTWTLDLSVRNARWVKHAHMPDPRNHIAAVNACGRILFIGGQHKMNEKVGNSRTVSEWLPEQRKWSTEPPPELPLPLGHISASVIAYKCGVLVVGGITNNIKHSDKVFYWHPRTNKWSLVGKYPIKVATPVCGILDDEIMCATGGKYIFQRHVYHARIDLG